MKIKRGQIFYVNLPMKVSFTTGFGTISSRDAVIVRLETFDGIVGWGEAAALSAPVYNAETSQTCIHLIRDFLLPRLINREIEIEEFVKETAFIRGNRIARFGVECALWCVKSLEIQKPLFKILGGVKNEVPVGESIGIQTSIEKTLAVIETKLQEGYQRIKIKIRPGWDLKLVKEIRKAYPKISLMVDANSSYRLKDLPLFQKLDQFNLLMIEQPLADDDIIDHAKIQSKISTPICLDESIDTAEDVRKALEIGACRIINVKPGRVGGLIESQKINELAKKEKISLWCGGMLETGVAKPFNLAAASLSEFTLPADMSPSAEFFNEDLTAPSVIVKKSGTISVPDQPGLGFGILEKNLAKYSIKTFEINK